MNEERLVAWLARRSGSGIGDDTAAIPPTRSSTIVTVDQQIEGIHFPAGLDPKIVARRLLRINLSDLAASGAVPRHAFLALAAPSGFDHRSFFRALLSEAKRFGVALSGGDLATAPSVHLSLTLLGEKRRGEATLGRDRARPGHRIWIGGTLGESAAGQRLVALGARPRGRAVELPKRFSNKVSVRRAAARAVWRHLLPSPQLELGRWLAGLGARRSGAAIDLSDGLAKDLHRLCDASGAGARVERAAIDAAAPPLFTELCSALGEEPGALLESGGEDYVLLFTLPPAIEPPPALDCRPIGVMTRGSRVEKIDARGKAARLAPRGWDHLAR